MNKRKLSSVPREPATKDMIELSKKLESMRHIVTVRLIEDNKIVLLNFYEIETLKKGKTEAIFRTFLSKEDYITQDLSVPKVKWKTASFYMMSDFQIYDSRWNSENHEYEHKELIYIRSEEEKKIIIDFFEEYKGEHDRIVPWSAINTFQQSVKDKRLEIRHKKETDAIDAVMTQVKNEVPQKLKKWVFEEAMSFSRYLIYKETQRGKAECECTYCKKIGIVDRDLIRLRNNEKGKCPFCGSKVTIKAKGKMPYRINNDRWVVYTQPTQKGFLWRYFHVHRDIYKEPDEKGNRIKEDIYECVRVFFNFSNGDIKEDSYEYIEYKNSGKIRWCHGMGRILCGLCILYPENLPQAWEHTPMKYSALEILSTNIPTEPLHYQWGIHRFLEFPKLEWFSKMGLNHLAQKVIDDGIGNWYCKLNEKGKTIFEILKLNKVNTRLLQTVDGNMEELYLLQTAQEIGYQFKQEQLQEYYETFGCDTKLLKQTNIKVSLHKIVKYITKESERYPLGNKAGCWMYPYNKYREREDQRIERKRNTAKDWLEYLNWCLELKYDLNNMFVYMPTNLKKVHDRTMIEYQALQDKKAAEQKRRQEELARKQMEETKKAMEELFKKNEGTTDAFAIKGKGLVIVVPKSADEIKAEGAALHHCVGSYVEKVAQGKTNIFFIRKSNEPEKPYFTMEFNSGKVIQCRGYKNCGMTPEVKALVNVFEQKMQKTVKNQRKVG